MGGGANNRKIHTWARKFNLTTGSLIKDWEDTLDGEEDYERERDEDESEEIDREEQRFLSQTDEEFNEERRLELGSEDQAEVVELEKSVDTALDALSDLPPLPERSVGREELVEQGHDLKRMAASYALKSLESLVPAFLDAVRQEQSETQKAVLRLREIERLLADLIKIRDDGRNLKSLLDSEYDLLDGFKERGEEAADNGDLDGLTKIHSECDDLVDRLFNDKSTLRDRVVGLVDANAPDRIVFEAWTMFQDAGGARNELGVNSAAWKKVMRLTVKAPDKYVIEEQRNCILHGRERHTFPGILGAGRILTDHATHVAIFDDPADLERAVNNAPTSPRSWRKLSNGFHGTNVGDARLYGGVNGDRVSLQTCFPVGGGTQYTREQVGMALDKCRGDLENFIGLVKGTIRPENL